MESFGIPRKLIKLAGLSVKNNKCKVKVENDSSTTIEVKMGDTRGWRSLMVFNIAVERVLKEIKKTELGIKIGNKTSVLTFADYLLLLAENKEDFKEIAKILNKEVQAVGLKVRDDKTKLMYFG